MIYSTQIQRGAFCVRLTAFDKEEGVILSQKALTKVLEAERKADAIRENAATEARTRRETCEASALRQRDERLSAERVAIRSREEEVRTRADALVVRSREEASVDIAAMQKAASSKMREAVKHIEWKLCDI